MGYVGSLEEYEGLEIVVESLKKLSEKGLNVKFLVISNGHNKEKFKRKFENDLMAEKIMIIGPINRNEILLYYSLIDVIVIPRYANSTMSRLVTPLKQMEALSLGIPLVVTNIPAINRIIGDGTATTFQSGDAKDLSSKLYHILTNKNLRTEKTKSGRNWIRENATWDIIAAKSIDGYYYLADEKRLN